MQKYAFHHIISLLLLSSPICAEELNSTKPQPASIGSLIQQLKNSPKNNRHILMNQLKRELRKVNSEHRKTAMIELKKSFVKTATGKKLHQQQNRLKNPNREQSTHQPKYRHLQYQQGQTNGRKGNGHK